MREKPFLKQLWAKGEAHELAFRDFAYRKGWRITKTGWHRLATARGWDPTLNKQYGWPDFLCLSRNGEWFAVEVKASFKWHNPRNNLKPNQKRCIDMLRDNGIRCFVSDGRNIKSCNLKKWVERPSLRISRDGQSAHLPSGSL